MGYWFVKVKVTCRRDTGCSLYQHYIGHCSLSVGSGLCFRPHVMIVSHFRWPRGQGVGLGRLVTGIMGSNPARGIYVRLCVSVLCCPVWAEVFATGWSLVQRSPTVCLNKITKPPVWGGQGPYKVCRATAAAADDDVMIVKRLSLFARVV
jgi:hypothetical protein